MIKAAIFDLDDTLISEKKYIESGYHHISKLLSVRFGKNEIELYHLLISLFKESPINVFNRLFNSLNMFYTKNDVIELVEEYRNHIPIIEFFDDVLPCIESLKMRGIKLGIITDGYTNAQRQKLNAIKANNYFDEIIVTDELGREFWKPHPKSFDIMRKKMNLEYHDMVYVGDNISKDFITPNKYGMKTIQISREDGVYNDARHLYNNDYHPSYSIKAMCELLGIFKLMEN